MSSLPFSTSVNPLPGSLRERALVAKQRPARYGPDLDLAQFGKPGERAPVGNLRSLHAQIREAALLAGIDAEETDRSASYFQIDYSVIYQSIQQAYQGKIELMTTQEALKRYEWLRDYWWKAVEVDSDKYTAAAELDQTGGFFLRVLAGQRVERPIQACLFVQENNISQNVHIPDHCGGKRRGTAHHGVYAASRCPGGIAHRRHRGVLESRVHIDGYHGP
jgi:hypothetical protein